MKTKKIKLTVELIFTGKGIVDREFLINNIANGIRNQANDVGIVADDEEEFAKTVDIRDENGHGMTLDVITSTFYNRK